MSEPAEPAPGRGDDPHGVGAWLAPFVRDPALWPVTAVVAAIFVVFGATGLLLAFAERNPFAIGAVLLAFWISVDASLRERRRGGSWIATGGAAVLWLGSAAAAIAVRAAGWF